MSRPVSTGRLLTGKQLNPVEATCTATNICNNQELFCTLVKNNNSNWQVSHIKSYYHSNRDYHYCET